MAISVDNLVDLVATTLAELGKHKWTDYASTYQRYPIGKNLIKKERRTVESGKSIQWNILKSGANLTRSVGLYEPNVFMVPEAMIQGTAPWRFFNTSMIIETREVAMNSGAAQIVSLIKERKALSMLSWVETLETLFWGDITSVTGEEFFSVPYWIQPNASTGFNGGAHSLYAAGPGGVSPTTYPAHRNWTAQYTVVDATFLDLVRQAIFDCDWEPGVNMPEYDTGGSHGMYCNWETRNAMVKFLESRNDNLGWSMDNEDRLRINRTPVTPVPALASNTKDPLYLFNFGEFKFTVLQGQYMVKDGPKKLANYSTAVGTLWDTAMNLVCTNRRKQAIIDKA